MGWSIGYDSRWKRDIGYGVPAYCDHPGCGEVIDRGLGYVCGGHPHGGEHGCGLFFCAKHTRYAGASRDHAPLCWRCWWRRSKPYTPSNDHPMWMRHKLLDESWSMWRHENPDLAKALRIALGDLKEQSDA